LVKIVRSLDHSFWRDRDFKIRARAVSRLVGQPSAVTAWSLCASRCVASRARARPRLEADRGCRAVLLWQLTSCEGCVSRRCWGGPAPCRPCLAVASSLGRWLPRPRWHGTVWVRRTTGVRLCRVGSNSPYQLYQLSPAAFFELGDLPFSPVSAIAALEPPLSPLLSPPSHANSTWA
jgi:hypothetical protein